MNKILVTWNGYYFSDFSCGQNKRHRFSCLYSIFALNFLTYCVEKDIIIMLVKNTILVLRAQALRKAYNKCLLTTIITPLRRKELPISGIYTGPARRHSATRYSITIAKTDRCMNSRTTTSGNICRTLRHISWTPPSRARGSPWSATLIRCGS